MIGLFEMLLIALTIWVLSGTLKTISNIPSKKYYTQIRNANIKIQIKLQGVPEESHKPIIYICICVVWAAVALYIVYLALLGAYINIDWFWTLTKIRAVMFIVDGYISYIKITTIYANTSLEKYAVYRFLKFVYSISYFILALILLFSMVLK